PKWRNWQTRMVQVHVRATGWRFKSSLRHLFALDATRTGGWSDGSILLIERSDEPPVFSLPQEDFAALAYVSKSTWGASRAASSISKYSAGPTPAKLAKKLLGNCRVNRFSVSTLSLYRIRST